MGEEAIVLQMALAVTLTGMAADLPRMNWNENVWRGLQDVLDSHAGDPNAYAVFDFDNTTAIGDISNTCQWRMLETLAFKLTPEELRAALSSEIPDLNCPLSPDKPSFTAANCAADLADLLRELKAVGGTEAERLASPAYAAFAAKYWAYYRGLLATFGWRTGYPWIAFIFTGWTHEEIQTFAQEAMRHETRMPGLREVSFSVPAAYAGRTGVLTAVEERGIAFTPEMKALYAALDRVGIAAYILSASNRELVLAVAPVFGVPPDRAFGYHTRRDVAGRYLPAYETDWIQSNATGKVATIRALIAPRHDGREPVLVGGDSMGDYNMLTEFRGLRAGLIFDRHPKAGPLRALIDGAPSSSRPRYLVQRRDAATGRLVPRDIEVD